MASTFRLSTVHRVWGLLTPAERRRAAVLLGLMLIGMLLETVGIGLVIPAVALLTQSSLASRYPALQPALHSLGNPSQVQLVVGGMLVLAGVYLVKALFLAFLAWRQARFAYGLQAELSQRLFTSYLFRPYTFHLQHNSAQLIRNVINEVKLFTDIGILPGMLLLTESLVLLGLCSLLLVVEPLGAIIVVGVLGTAAWGSYRLTRTRITRWGEVRQHHDGWRMQHLQQGLGGVKDVKLLGREAEFLEQYRVHNAQSARVAQLQYTVGQFPRLWLEVLAVAGLATLVISMLAQGRPVEAVLPTLSLFAAAAFRIIPSAHRMLHSMQELRYSLPVIDVLHGELRPAKPDKVPGRSPGAPLRSALELRQVTYAYPDAERPSLRDVSLVVRHGESVGFIGASGAGKSTLVDIVLGLLAPDSGSVRVDGEDIRNRLRDWQDQIGYVPQSIFLTDDTLRRNVAFGLPNDQIDDDAVRRAIQAAQLEEFVAGLPEGLETIVGERGVRLSGGQRQRIGIARALYHAPAVLLLDEATSSLDTDTEHGVMQAVRALRGMKTILIVTHRLTTVEHCDRLYRLHDGRIVEETAPKAVTSPQQQHDAGQVPAKLHRDTRT